MTAPFPIGRNDAAEEPTAEATSATGETVGSFLSQIVGPVTPPMAAALESPPTGAAAELIRR